MLLRTTKRRRIVYSCENCRRKKLKCDRGKPKCTNCVKQDNPCEYISQGPLNDKDAIENQIQAIKQQIETLEAQRDATSLTHTYEVINFSQVFSLSSLIKGSKYQKSILDSSNFGKSLPLFIEEALNKEIDKISNLDLLKFNLRQDGNVYDLIRPYFADIQQVKSYMSRVFETELYANFSYMNKAEFQLKVDEFFNSPKLKMNKDDYVFVGQLLLVMRIAYISMYNCGYEQDHPGLVVGVEAFNLANICFEEVKFPLHFQNIETMRLMLLIFDAEMNSPEGLVSNFGLRQGTVQHLTRSGVGLKFNIDPGDSKDSDYIRKIWHQILDIERIDLIYTGSSIFTELETYKTLLPVLDQNDTKSLDYLISKRFHDRSTEFKEILTEISRMITNAKLPSSIEDFQKVLNKLVERCNNSSLESILKLESHSTEQKVIKTFKFVDFLDLHCLTYMLASKVFLYHDDRDDTPEKIQSIENVIRIGNSMIVLAYFIDPHQQHFYNLGEHFGSNIQLIPKILQSLHRVIQLQYTLLGKSYYQHLITPNFKLAEIKRISVQNLKVIISSVGKISQRYLYAKSFYMVHSYLSFKVLDLNSEILNSEIPQGYVQSLRSKNVHPMSDSNIDAIVRNLIELTGDPSIPGAVYEEPVANYFETLFTNLDFKVSTKEEFSLDTIDHFLSINSFL